MLNARLIGWRPLVAAVILAVATLAAMVVLLAGTASAEPPENDRVPFCITVGGGPADLEAVCDDTDGIAPPEVIMDGVLLNNPS